MSARNYRNSSLLSTIAATKNSCSETMPPKTEKAKDALEDIYREPESDSSSNGSSSKAANINSTAFTSNSLQTQDGSKPAARTSTRASNNRSSRLTPHGSHLSSSEASNVNKRKSEDDDKIFGAAIKKRTIFDGTSFTKNAKPKTQYIRGAKSQIYTKSKSSRQQPYSTAQSRKFIAHDTSLSSDEDDPPPAKSKSTKGSKYIPPVDSSPEKPKPSITKKKFIVHETSDIEDSPMTKLDVNTTKFKLPSLPNSPAGYQESSPRPQVKDSGLKRESSSPEPPEKPLDVFQRLKLKFPESLSDMLSDDVTRARTQSPIEDDAVLAPSLGRCPMCNKPVNKKLLKSQGFMNIRQQERFCNSHQKDSALYEWNDKGYPEINWNSLDSRIARHHDFIEKLIRGQDSHYRNLLDDIVEAGTERNLLKSKGNLTPGYYGSRGLQAISENIMLKFTPLLKERAVRDKAVMARGVTGFVQMVLVPEVATLLIMEDMSVDEEKARDVLTESIGLGDMVHEEIQDVVVRKKDDGSDDEQDSDGDTDD